MYGDGAAPALTDVSLTVEPGERVAMVGPSGAGKSTMIALANGLVQPTSGQVIAAGVDTRDLGHRRHRADRRRIGTVHQDLALVGPLRAATNVAAGRLGVWGSVRALRSLFRPVEIDEITDVLDRLGIADQLWARTDTLSGGQRQRVAIARALFQQPDLLLADEPVSSLDPTRSEDVLDILVSHVASGADRAMVASLHDAPLALSHFDRVVGLRAGMVEFDRPAAEVSPELLRDLYAFERTPDEQPSGP